MAAHPTCQHDHRVVIDQATREGIEPRFEDLAPADFFERCGPNGPHHSSGQEKSDEQTSA